MDLIDWWINLEPLSVEEKKLLTSSRNDEFIDKIFTVSLTSEFIKRLPNCNLSNEYQVRVDNCATNLIQSLFNTYIDDDTLVIYTENEHYKIKGILDAFKNKLPYRYYTIKEYCRLQNVPEDYFDGVASDNQIRKMIGNGWTVDVIVHIFKEMFSNKNI